MISIFFLSYAASQRNLEQFLRLYRKLHRELVEYLFRISVDNQPDRILLVYAPLPAIKKLVLSYPGGSRLMLYDRCLVIAFDIGKCMRPAFIAQQQTVALGVIPRIFGIRSHSDQSPVAVLAASCGNSFAHDPAPGIFPQMNHFSACVRLLMMVGYRHRIKLGYGIVPL